MSTPTDAPGTNLPPSPEKDEQDIVVLQADVQKLKQQINQLTRTRPWHCRILWRSTEEAEKTVFTPMIKAHSYVVITAAEAKISDTPGDPTNPDGSLGEPVVVRRKDGAATNIQATNIAPFDGGVSFRLHLKESDDDSLDDTVGFDPALEVWTDITVFDRSEQAFWMQSEGDSADATQAQAWQYSNRCWRSLGRLLGACFSNGPKYVRGEAKRPWLLWTISLSDRGLAPACIAVWPGEAG